MARVFSLSMKETGAGKEEQDEYARQAVELLRKAGGQHYFAEEDNLALLAQHEDFQPLHPRPDFQRLLKELKSAP
jgi:hypothetical protein